MTGVLWVVATPIGNLEDLTMRALRVLRECDAVLAEDTRRSGVLLKHYAIETPLRSFHAHTPDAKVESWLDELEAGRNLAIITDAGTPLISDPGARLVEGARARGLVVHAVPGPSAVIAALSIAGIRADRFAFEGFVPRSGTARREALQNIEESPRATVVFESPRRLGTLLNDLASRIGDRRVAVCRELTKLHEEVAQGTASELAARFSEPPKGEITVVIEGRRGERSELDVEEAIAAGLRAGQKPGDIAKAVAAMGVLSRSEAYERVLSARQEEE